MTPDSIRKVGQLRQEFYQRFTAAMNVPVNISSAYTGNFSIASWIDDSCRMNYVCIYACAAPDALILERPLLLRVAINRGAGAVSATRWGKSCQGLNRSWQFELTLLPEEVLDFLPWVVHLIKSRSKEAALNIVVPPHPIDFKPSYPRSFDNAWSHSAGSKIATQFLS